MTTTDRVDKYYKELYRLMWAMVWDYANHNRWMLQPDELFAELSLELVKVIDVYTDKADGELKNLLIKSLRNRCIDLVTMAYNTHRSAEATMMSLSSMIDFDDDSLAVVGMPSHSGPESLLNIDDFVASLSSDAGILIREVLNPSDRMLAQLDLFRLRKIATCPGKDWHIETNPLILQRALGWDKGRLTCAWEEVKTALSDFI